MAQTDYEIFTARIKDFEGELVRVIGALPEAKARYEAWWTPKAGGFVLGVDEATGQIGVYEFVGVPGAPLAQDVEWLERKHDTGEQDECWLNDDGSDPVAAELYMDDRGDNW